MTMMKRSAMKQREAEREEGRYAGIVPVFLILSFILGAAHLWRSGQAGAAFVCLAWGLICVSRRAWMRPVSFAALLFLAVEWIVTVQTLVHIRVAMQAPWIRLALILTGVTAVTAGAALLTWASSGRAWFCRERGVACMQVTSFLLAAVPLLLMTQFSPHLLLAERFFPGFGMVQAWLAGVWSSRICARLYDRRTAPRTRMRVWRLFSVVFFGQFVLALLGWSLFAMTGELHIPVPGVIIAGAIYRGSAGFMPVLFLVSLMLVGAAWCSHLCYFGSWDAWAASGRRPSVHPGPLRWRVLSLMLVCGAAFVLRRVPSGVSVACGAALGFLMLPVSLLVSRTKHWAAYCTTVCPLGLLSCLLGRLSFWRIRRTASCTRCGACTRICRYGALDRNRLEAGSPGLSCTLCRDCLNVCAHGGLCMTWLGLGAGGAAERAFVVLAAAMHSLFLFSAMV